jgi:cardiolipin synthase
MALPPVSNRTWLRTGEAGMGALRDAVAAARRSIRLETYIFSAEGPGQEVRDALVQARGRGVTVAVLIDAFGSLTLSDSFWGPLRQAGGEVRWFNPLRLRRFYFRDHRKLLACDGTVGIVGGFNVAPEYVGDGVTRGWRDVGLRIEGPLVADLEQAFDSMFARAALPHGPFMRLRRSGARAMVSAGDSALLLSAPGRGRNPIKRSLLRDLRPARRVQIVAAYFLPQQRLRRALACVARRGGDVRLILAGQSDMPLLQWAGRSLYQRLLRAGVAIYEYEPQVLHTKLMIIDRAVYVGSANLDPRSLSINYELLVRLTDPAAAAEAGVIVADHLAHARRIDLHA